MLRTLRLTVAATLIALLTAVGGLAAAGTASAAPVTPGIGWDDEPVGVNP